MTASLSTRAGAGMDLLASRLESTALGVVPVLLAKWLADRKPPAGDQFPPPFCLQRAVDRNIHA